MEIKVYVDVLLLTNVVFNFLLLKITGLLLRQPAKTWLLLSVSALGGVYAVLAFFLPDSLLYSLVGKLFMGGLMVTIAFRPACLRAWVKYVCVFYAVVFLYSGMAMSFFYFSDGATLLGSAIQNGILYVNLPVHLLLLLSCLAGAILKTAFSIGARISACGKEIATLLIYHRGKTVTLRGFYDSGNLLRKEPEDRGVMICSWESVKPLFSPQKTLEEVQKKEKGLFFIPFSTLQADGRLPGFFPDAVYLKKGRRFFRTEDVCIGIASRKPDYYNNWDAILPHDFKGVEYYEQNLDSEDAELFMF